MNQNVKPPFPRARLKSQTLTQVTVQEMRDAIEHGIYAPGSQLPPEIELGRMFGVSRTIIRDALRFLEQDGLITRRQGIGTFVRKNPILLNLSLDYGTKEMIKSAGMVPSTPYLRIQDDAASPEIAKALGLAVGTPIVMIERVRAADGKPVVHGMDYIAKSLVGDRDLKAYWKDYQDVSLYQLLQGPLGLVIEYGVTRILPGKPPPHIAEMLNVSPETTLLYMIQTDYGPDDTPVLYTCEYHLPDAFDFVVVRRGPRKPETGSDVSFEDRD